MRLSNSPPSSYRVHTVGTAHSGVHLWSRGDVNHYTKELQICLEKVVITGGAGASKRLASHEGHRWGRRMTTDTTEAMSKGHSL